MKRTTSMVVTLAALTGCGSDPVPPPSPWEEWCAEKCGLVDARVAELGCSAQPECAAECLESEDDPCAESLSAWQACQLADEMRCDPASNQLVAAPWTCMAEEIAWRDCIGITCSNFLAPCPVHKCPDGPLLSECVNESCVEDAAVVCAPRSCVTADECPVILCDEGIGSNKRTSECLPDGMCATTCTN